MLTGVWGLNLISVSLAALSAGLVCFGVLAPNIRRRFSLRDRQMFAQAGGWGSQGFVRGMNPQNLQSELGKILPVDNYQAAFPPSRETKAVVKILDKVSMQTNLFVMNQAVEASQNDIGFKGLNEKQMARQSEQINNAVFQLVKLINGEQPVESSGLSATDELFHTIADGKQTKGQERYAADDEQEVEDEIVYHHDAE